MSYRITGADDAFAMASENVFETEADGMESMEHLRELYPAGQFSVEEYDDPDLTYLSGIDVSADIDSVTLQTKTHPTSISYEITDGVILVNMTEYRAFCTREDISLSDSEVRDLLDWMESEIACV
jgi:hypothetical protein